MFDTVATVKSALEGLSRDFEPATLSGPNAVRMVGELATIRRLTDAMLAKAARRVDETSAHVRGNDRDADPPRAQPAARPADRGRSNCHFRLQQKRWMRRHASSSLSVAVA